MSTMVYERRHTCRACHADALHPVLYLGPQPLANSLLREDQLDEPELKVPLHLVTCPKCGMFQLTHVVSPEILYGQHYPYRSGYSQGWVNHCHALAKEIGRGKRVLDIGCLDGILLRHCRDNGCDVVGVDPSGGGDFPLIKEFFSQDTKLPYYFDVIVAQNVFGHVDNALGFLKGIAGALTKQGTAIIECPWVVDMLDKGEWDTIYHEHLSYWGIRPLAKVARAANLYITDIKHFPTLHGGTMRYYLAHRDKEAARVSREFCLAWEREEAINEKELVQFANHAESQLEEWNKYLSAPHHKQIAGYAASAKASTFLNSLTDRPWISGIFDDTPSKWNLYTPGWHIPILRPTRMVMKEVDELICFAPNWAAECELRASELGFEGRVITLWGNDRLAA